MLYIICNTNMPEWMFPVERRRARLPPPPALARPVATRPRAKINVRGTL